MIHPTVTMTTPDGRTVEIDEGLAPLIEQSWTADIKTSGCCQDASAGFDGGPEHLQAYAEARRGRAYVDFPTPADLCAFLAVVANAGPRDAFYVRLMHWAAPDAWLITAGVEDLAIGDDGEADGPSDFVVGTYHVEFPATDVPEMVERLRRHNRGEPPVLGPIDWTTVEVEVPDAEV